MRVPCELSGEGSVQGADSLFGLPELSLKFGQYAGVAAMRSLSAASAYLQRSTGGSLRALAGLLHPSIFVLAGRPTSFEVLHPHGEWEQLPSATCSRSNCAAVAVGTRIILLGGWAEGGAMLYVDEVFDLPSGSWASLENSMPTRRALLAAAVGGPRWGFDFAAFGGIGMDGQQLAQVEAFGREGWLELPQLATRRSGCASARVGERIYCIGGQSPSGRHLDSVESLALGDTAWQQAARLPAPVVSCSAAALAGRLFVFGGWGKTSPLSAACCLTPGADAWEVLPAMPTERTACTAVPAAGKLYVFGGRAISAQATAAAERFDPTRREWHAMPPLLVARSGCSAVAVWT